MKLATRRIRLRQRPSGALAAEDFLIDHLDVREPSPGEVLVRVRYLSLDPYLARRMRTWEGPEQEWRDGVVVGRSIAEVVQSNDPGLHPGDRVLVNGPWQEYLVQRAANLYKLDMTVERPSSFLGVLGSSGVTAWCGMNKVIAPREGETVVVSAAGGPVGSVAGQLARLAGARVVGIAGGIEKCDYVTSELGFDACVDHRRPDFREALAAATPDGIDAHFENVGADTLDPVLERMNKGGRVALCGLFQHYQDELPVSLRHFRSLLDKAIRIQGFHVGDYAAEFEGAVQELAKHVHAGTLQYRETVTVGFEHAPQAYIRMLAATGIGKHLVVVE